ncbi:hypothetical protein HII17_00545 [Thalassotalea sp. M1531]|uniref:Uncharacterized protein n=1 Tax=Thalassotalea algicola TaxID=2716224 RepID=A0A7Y0Q4J8_9GAMM|nr:hypothetical protein [Thalassotalea algicola]NMP30034.1 hypothetical protein [Thalassotalea algicola]
MSLIDKSQAEGLVNRIMRGFKHSGDNHEFSQLGNYKRKKQSRELVKLSKRINQLSFIEQRYQESAKCEVIYGEWSLSGKNTGSLSGLEYDTVGFDLIIDTPEGQRDKFFYLHLSKHALVRLIMRSHVELKNSTQLRSFLDSICKKLILSCCALWSKSIKSQKVKNEGYVLINDLFIPVVMETGKNIRNQEARVFTIKTVMPKEYDGAKSSISNEISLPIKGSIFDYTDIIQAS